MKIILFILLLGLFLGLIFVFSVQAKIKVKISMKYLEIRYFNIRLVKISTEWIAKKIQVLTKKKELKTVNRRLEHLLAHVDVRSIFVEFQTKEAISAEEYFILAFISQYNSLRNQNVITGPNVKIKRKNGDFFFKIEVHLSANLAHLLFHYLKIRRPVYGKQTQL